MRILAVLWIACALGGCVGRMMKEGTTALVGQPLDAAIAKLGIPSSEAVIADKKVYIWSTRNVIEGTEYKCQIRAIMSGDVIGSFDWEGSNCGRYASKLS